MAVDLTIDGRMKNERDIQRNWKWELWIPKPKAVTNWDMDDMIIRCRSAVIPGRGNEPIESNFNGQKQFFPGKPLFPNTFITMFEEFEDKKVSKFLYSWQQAMHDYSGETSNPGSAKSGSKKDITSQMKLRQYGVDGKIIQDLIFVNAWVQNVDDVTMDYTGAESVKYSVTFQYDYWKLQG